MPGSDQGQDDFPDVGTRVKGLGMLGLRCGAGREKGVSPFQEGFGAEDGLRAHPALDFSSSSPTLLCFSRGHGCALHFAEQCGMGSVLLGGVGVGNSFPAPLPIPSQPSLPSCLEFLIPLSRLLWRAREAEAGNVGCCQMARNAASVILYQKKLRPNHSP